MNTHPFKAALTFTLLFAAIILTLAPPALAEKQEVRIGVIVPLTGPSSWIGDQVQHTISLLKPNLDTASKRYIFKFVVEDGKQGLTNAATTAVMKLISVDRIHLLITGTSGETLQAGPIAERNSVPTFGVIASHRDVKTLGPHVFRTFLDIERSFEALLKRIHSSDSLPTAVITEDDPFTQGIKQILSERLTGQIVFEDDYQVGDLDFKTLITKATSKHPKSLYLNCATPISCSTIVNQVRQLNITLPLYSYFHPENPNFLKSTKDNSNGLEFLGVPSIKDATAEFKKFHSRYTKQLGKPPTSDLLFRSTYDAVIAFSRAVEAVGTDSEKIINFLNSYKTKGALGEVEFDENGDIKDINYAVKRIENNKPVLISNN